MDSENNAILVMELKLDDQPRLKVPAVVSTRYSGFPFRLTELCRETIAEDIRQLQGYPDSHQPNYR